MSGLANVEGLNRASQKYQPVLQMLPFLVLQNVMSELEINLLEVSSKDIAVQMLRKGGVSAPYIATTSDDDHITSEELGKFVERILTVEPCVAVIKDHIMNYKDKLILNNDPNSQKVDNKTKKHPLEFLFLQAKVKTIAEDIIDALFFAERNTADKSPMGMFNGYNTILDSLVSAGEISTAKKNLVNTGSIETPADVDEETDAWIKSTGAYLYQRIGCKGFVRFDFILTPQELYFLEVNTVPGISPASIIPKQAQVMGISLEQLFDLALDDII